MLGHSDKRGLDRTPARHKRLGPFDERDEGALGVRSTARRRALDIDRRDHESRVRSGDCKRRSDRDRQADDRDGRGRNQRRDDLCPKQVDLAPAETAPRELVRDQE